MDAGRELKTSEIVGMSSRFYESATLFAAIEAGLFSCLHETAGATAEIVVSRPTFACRACL